ncbi:isochorismatase family protein [Paenalcaligenes niemegkensis]|uniref:isochorismatase family protein n=1 Tax=Paenalcaligenes niemegkensis TaxID=2895469 RepID=UPI001EE93734|nr:isochorismatase family protein [Paenalcaligenes niemegkensis]MCQ9617705.1 isochorismatase family protein [Paenalcaligenes niemegkensis]
MQKRIWDDLITQREKDLYQKTGFGKKSGLGERCALLVIDAQRRTIGSKSQPIEEAIQEFPTSCGEYAWNALPQIKALVDFFHEKNWPIFYPYVAYKNDYDQGQFGTKVSAVMNVPIEGYEFPTAIEPKNGAIKVAKYHPSAFFGTSLASYLIERRIDTLIVTGATTSGCVRGTVVDASSLNYKVVVVEDAVFDRVPSSHAVNLFDMASKYADVMPAEELIALLDDVKVYA